MGGSNLWISPPVHVPDASQRLRLRPVSLQALCTAERGAGNGAFQTFGTGPAQPGSVFRNGRNADIRARARLRPTPARTFIVVDATMATRPARRLNHLILTCSVDAGAGARPQTSTTRVGSSQHNVGTRQIALILLFAVVRCTVRHPG